jgi:AraC-like DNA-binding protein
MQRQQCEQCELDYDWLDSILGRCHFGRMDVNLHGASEDMPSTKSGLSQPSEPEDTGGYITECSDTRRASEDALGYWIDHIRTYQGSLHIRGFADTAVFRGRALVQRDADHQLVDKWSDSVHYSRTDADVRADGRSDSALIVPRRGVFDVEQAEERIRLRPGHGVIVSKARALQLRHDFWARSWTFNTIDGRWRGASEQRPVTLDLRHGLGSIVRTMIRAVSKQLRSLDSYEFARSCAAITDLLLACALDHGGLPDNLHSVERAVREYVALHACEPDLTPSTVARSLGWSVRQVQLALQRAGTTTSDLIRSTRLTSAADLLRNSPPGTTIASIASASGFRSMTTFEVAFKKQFCITPSEARIAHRRGENLLSAPPGMGPHANDADSEGL